jgi:hypothetical protein
VIIELYIISIWRISASAQVELNNLHGNTHPTLERELNNQIGFQYIIITNESYGLDFSVYWKVIYADATISKEH